MKKILTVLGARPQLIKASVVSEAIAESGKLSEVVVHTGQHFDAAMSDIFFSELGMNKPAYNLGVHGGGHGEMTARMLAEIEKVLLTEKPDAVLVYGDTNSTLAGALAAVKLHIPVAHVEAGLRSFNMKMPEEINRIVTDRISDWLFAPTETGVQHLLNEGVSQQKIAQVGDVMFDVALRHGERAEREEGLLRKLAEQFGIKPGQYCLATIHRAENTDAPSRLAVIVEAIANFAKELPVVWPLHPRTRAVLARERLLDKLGQGVVLIDPVGYLDMVQLEKNAALITTDSGGVQKEAFFHRIPCVTLRDETEWGELIEAGWNRLVSPQRASEVCAAFRSALGTAGQELTLYGQGTAAQKIVKHLVREMS